MAKGELLNVMILVKAAPILTRELRETMCVAAMTLDDNPKWIRLYPVPFRDLEDESKFRKYQEVEVRAIRSSSDRCPESWAPLEGSIRLGGTIGTQHGWSTRRERVKKLGEHIMCDLVEANRSGSGDDTLSLAVVRTLEPPKLLIDRRDAEQIDEWRKRAAAMAARPSLFDGPSNSRSEFDVIPWRFRYHYWCLASQCKGHKQTIVDWEAVSLYRNVRQQENW